MYEKKKGLLETLIFLIEVEITMENKSYNIIS